MTLQSNAAPEAPGAAAHARQPDHARRDAFGRNVSGPLAGIVIAEFSRVLAGQSTYYRP